MLEEYKKIYEASADLYVPNWRNINKNILVKQAIECANTPSEDGYIGAIMLKYWEKMLKYYRWCKLVITPEDAHCWLTQAVMYAIEQHPWTREKSSIYDDPNGPDKVINRVLESKRVTFYQQLNRYNRKINSSTVSLNLLVDLYGDGLDGPITTSDETLVMIDELILNFFKSKEYFLAFLVDSIVYEGYELDNHSKKLVTHLRVMSDEYCDTFSIRHCLPLSRVVKASTYITRMTRFRIKNKLKSSVFELQKFLKTQWGV